MKRSLLKRKVLAIILALTFVLPQSACATPISASATEDTEPAATEETVADEDVLIDEEDDYGDTFDVSEDSDADAEDAMLEYYEEEGIEAPEEIETELPEDPMERLQYNIDRLPDPEFWETVTDPLELDMLIAKYGSFASDLMDEVYELSEEDMDSLDLSRLEAYFTYEDSDVSTMAGDTDRQNKTLQVLPEEVYNTATFPESYSHLVFYTRPFKRADDFGSACTVRMRKSQSIIAPNNTTSKREDVFVRLNRVAREDEA